MRYSSEHKEQSHRRILAEAARLFRLHGYTGVGIDEIMRAADLTRGGFYQHFHSKEDLFREVLDREPDFETRLRRAKAAHEDDPLAGVREVVADYLTPAHLARVSAGCPMASNTQDVRRAGPQVRAAFTRQLRHLLAELAGPLPNSRGEADGRALRALALAVGGVILARAVNDASLAEAIVDACREGALEELSGDEPE